MNKHSNKFAVLKLVNFGISHVFYTTKCKSTAVTCFDRLLFPIIDEIFNNSPLILIMCTFFMLSKLSTTSIL